MFPPSSQRSAGVVVSILFTRISGPCPPGRTNRPVVSIWSTAFPMNCPELMGHCPLRKIVHPEAPFSTPDRIFRSPRISTSEITSTWFPGAVRVFATARCCRISVGLVFPGGTWKLYIRGVRPTLPVSSSALVPPIAKFWLSTMNAPSARIVPVFREAVAPAWKRKSPSVGPPSRPRTHKRPVLTMSKAGTWPATSGGFVCPTRNSPRTSSVAMPNQTRPLRTWIVPVMAPRSSTNRSKAVLRLSSRKPGTWIVEYRVTRLFFGSVVPAVRLNDTAMRL